MITFGALSTIFLYCGSAVWFAISIRIAATQGLRPSIFGFFVAAIMLLGALA